MRSAVVLIAALAFSAPPAAQAQSREQCRRMARNASATLGAAIVNLERAEGMGRHISTLKSTSSGELRATLDRFDDARRNLAVALREFINATRSLRDVSEACS